MQTKGEKIVRVDFNVNDDSKVHEIKVEMAKVLNDLFSIKFRFDNVDKVMLEYITELDPEDTESIAEANRLKAIVSEIRDGTLEPMTDALVEEVEAYAMTCVKLVTSHYYK